MPIDLEKATAANAQMKPGSPVVAVPIIPTIGMMIAAADVSNVFMPGDRLADWLLPEIEALEGEASIDPGLVAMFGRRRAYEISVMAELWAGCLAGLDEWSHRRATQGSDKFVDSWFSPIVDTCPESGWPAAISACTPEHRDHAKSFRMEPPFASSSTLVRFHDLPTIRLAPARCAAIMAMRAGQRELLFDYVFSVEDTVDMSALPYVPGYSIENRMDNEERHFLMAAAAWRGAVSWLLESERSHEEQMPLSPVATSVFLSHLVYHNVERATTLVKGFYENGPYTRAVVGSDVAELVFTGAGADLFVEYKHLSGKRFSMQGYDVRLPWVADDLMRLVREFSGHENVSLIVESTLNA